MPRDDSKIGDVVLNGPLNSSVSSVEYLIFYSVSVSWCLDGPDHLLGSILVLRVSLFHQKHGSDGKKQTNEQTRRRSESAYIRQVNFLQLLCRLGE